MPVMSMLLLPEWLRVGWVVALGAVVVVHLRHAWSTSGPGRWWHGGHILMATGMAGMYLLNPMTHPDLSRVGTSLFAAVAVVVTVAAAAFRRREGALDPLWVVAALDMLVMAYMWLPDPARPPLLSYAFAVYLGGQVLAWALGRWDRVPVSTRPAAPAMVGSGRLGPVVEPPVVEPNGETTELATAAAAPLGLAAHCTPVVRASLAVMAAGMGYMLAVM